MSVNRKHDCAEDLRRRILTMDLGPGSELDETRLAAHYGLSRTPLREVFQGLAGEGYIRLEQHRGARVAAMDLGTLRMFFQTAPLVYCALARQAALARTSEQLEALGQVQQALGTAIEDEGGAELALLNHRFHTLVGEMAYNPYLMPSLARMLLDHTRLSLGHDSPASKKEKKLVRKAMQQHETLIAALTAQDAQAAAEVTLAHWDLARAEMERFAHPDPLPDDTPAPSPASDTAEAAPKPVKGGKKKKA